MFERLLGKDSNWLESNESCMTVCPMTPTEDLHNAGYQQYCVTKLQNRVEARLERLRAESWAMACRKFVCNSLEPYLKLQILFKDFGKMTEEDIRVAMDNMKHKATKSKHLFTNLHQVRQSAF